MPLYWLQKLIKEEQGAPWAAAIADMVATSTAAEEETPLPSGTAEET